MNYADKLNRLRDREAEKQRIYEPKYGGKDHSGYDTLMKYEINDEREECYSLGFNRLKGITLELAEALKAYSTTGYENRSAGSHAEHIERQIEEIRAKTAREALAKLEKELGDG